jgi:hypothetical protein
LAKFWTTKKNLITGDDRNTVRFDNGIYDTSDPDDIKMLRKKAKIRGLEIVEITSKEEDTKADKKSETKSKAISSDKSKK